MHSFLAFESFSVMAKFLVLDVRFFSMKNILLYSDSFFCIILVLMKIIIIVIKQATGNPIHIPFGPIRLYNVITQSNGGTSVKSADINVERADLSMAS